MRRKEVPGFCTRNHPESQACFFLGTTVSGCTGCRVFRLPIPHRINDFPQEFIECEIFIGEVATAVPALHVDPVTGRDWRVPDGLLKLAAHCREIVGRLTR